MDQKFPFEHFLDFNKQDENKFKINDDFKAKEIKPIEKNELSTDNYFSTEELRSITDTLSSELKKIIPEEKYKSFFENNFTVSNISSEKFYINVTNLLIKTMFEKHYESVIEEAISSLMGKKFSVIVNLFSETQKERPVKKTDSGYKVRKGTSAKNTGFSLSSLPYETPVNEQYEEIKDTDIKIEKSYYMGQRIDPNKTFDNFIVGPSNNMAHAFAFSVAENPGTVYPQLYLYGNSGLGKTHLLHAICNHVNEKRPNLRINFTSANAFMNEMVIAIQKKVDDKFRRKYCDMVDILIIDDIHELKEKERTQNEFFHIFNELQSKGKQLIFTSDKQPKEILGLEERIRTRLSSALLTEIQQPDLETRIAILRKKAIEKDLYLDDETINFIASCVKTNVRELEGNLVKLQAYSKLINVEIDLETAKIQLNLTDTTEVKSVTIESIAKSVSSYFKLSLGDMRGKSRVKAYTHARHIAMYLTYKILKVPLAEIGHYYGRRDHTTVMSAVNKFKNQKDNQQLTRELFEIEATL